VFDFVKDNSPVAAIRIRRREETPGAGFAASGRLRGARPDAFAITPVSDSLVCAGVTDRGTLYAVYALLEELGVRFYAPDFPFYDGHHERVPNRESVSVAVDRLAEPSLGYRTKDVHGPGATPGTLPAVIEWLAKTRHNVGTSRPT